MQKFLENLYIYSKKFQCKADEFTSWILLS